MLYILNKLCFICLHRLFSRSYAVYSYVNFYLSFRSDYLTIATTRPETLFGDVAIAVHPKVG